jgi:uncharacterized Tic20 family protein
MENNPYAYDSNVPNPPDGLTSEVRNWAMLCHLVALLAMPLGFGHILGPLIVWLLKRETHPFIDDQGKESLNFQISMSIYTLVAALTLCIVIGIVLLPAMLVLNVIFVIIASIKASSGEAYRYPLTIRLVK